MKLKVCLAQGTIWSGYSKRKTYIVSLQKLKTFKQELSTWSEVWKKLLHYAILTVYKRRQMICTGTWNHASLEFKLGEDCWNIILQEVDLLLVSTDDSIYCYNYCWIYCLDLLLELLLHILSRLLEITWPTLNFIMVLKLY